MQDRQAKTYRDLKLSDHTGFSLDPDFDYTGLHDWFTDDPWFGQGVAAKLVKYAKVDRAEVARVTDGFARGDPLPYLVMIHRLRDGDLLAMLVAEEIDDRVRKEFNYQAARYDGDLQGTEVGMMMLYTDLLAKLWESLGTDSPKGDIAEFPTGTDGGVAPVYKQQTVETPGTRLWFGTHDAGFQTVSGRPEIIFAPRLTRLFAASSHELDRGKEVPPTQSDEQTIGWWDDHYDEVARYEPEYERLNQYVKWSAVLAWLSTREEFRGGLSGRLVTVNYLDRLGFLSQVEVTRTHWFPDWVKEHPELRYRQWERVKFRPRGDRGLRTEALPILFSDPFPNFGEKGANWRVSGGIGTDPRMVRQATPLPVDVPPDSQLSLRGANPRTVESTDYVRTLDGVAFEFSPGGLTAAAEITPPKGTRVEGRYGDLAPSTFTRTTSEKPGGRLVVSLRTKIGPVGELTVRPAAGSPSSSGVAIS